MDEEGSIVYYKTSPSIQNSQEELTFGDARLNPLLLSNSTQNQSTQQTFLKRISDCTQWLAARVSCSDQGKLIVSELKQSSLLTEEDSHILHISLSHHFPPTLSNTKNHSTSPHRIYYYTVALFVILGAILWCMEIQTLLVCITALILILVATMARFNRRRLSNQWREYSNMCEKVLSLLTKALRLIQETEVISRGYSRPSAAVPVSRIELNGCTKLQCVSLRRRVFNVCHRGVLLLRRLTRELCTDVPIIMELDNIEDYMAFRELRDLHCYMEEDENEEKFSLESLKDASNLFAVQNSEFLRRLALVVALSNKNPSSVTLWENSLSDMLLLVKKMHGDLEWSLQHQRDYLFGEPPARASQESEQQYHPELQPFVEEVHCMDLKLQLALQRVRDMGVLLTEKYSTGVRPCEEEAQELSDQISGIELSLANISEHVNDGATVLEQLHPCSPLNNESNTQQEDINGNYPTECTNQEPATPEEFSDDEDLVFEAYIPPDAPDEPNTRHITTEERELDEMKEVPAHLFRELTSVLAVRNEAREQRRKEKRTRKHNKIWPPQHHDNHIHTSTTTEDLSKEQDTKLPLQELQASTDSIDTSAASKNEQPDSSSTRNDEKAKQHLSVCEGSSEPELKEQLAPQTTFMAGLEQSSLAQAVAAVALRQKQHAEVFFEHDND